MMFEKEEEGWFNSGDDSSNDDLYEYSEEERGYSNAPTQKKKSRFQKKWDKALVKAVKKDNLKALRHAIKKGANVNVRDLDSVVIEGGGSQRELYSPIIFKTVNNYDCFKALIDAGANINLLNDVGNSLMFSLNPHDDFYMDYFNTLLEHGFDLSYQKNGDDALLLYRLIRHRLYTSDTYLNNTKAAIDILLKKNIDINIQCAKGETALIRAVHYDRFDIVGKLIQAKADINLADKSGTTPLMYAAKRESESVLELLLEAKADINAQNENGDTALMFAARNRNSDTSLKCIVAQSPDINIQNENGDTALMIAIRNGLQDHAKILIDIGADLTLTNANGKTALNLAHETGLSECATKIESKTTPTSEDGHYFVNKDMVTTVIGTCPIKGALAMTFNFKGKTIETAGGMLMSFDDYQNTSCTAQTDIEAAFNWLKAHPEGAPAYPFKKSVEFPSLKSVKKNK